MAAKAPPLSARGALQALRWPQRSDLILSIKGVAASALALAIGFGANLENPYWSALTIYVLLSQSETGAIRSKGLFRFVGTLIGGVAAIVLTALFGDSVGALLVATMGFILVVFYLKLLDRTPANYIWFATSLTTAVIGITRVQSPDAIFATAVARMLEISLGVLCLGLVDTVIGSKSQTPAFLAAMGEWRDQAGDWAARALSPDASNADDARLKRRMALRDISRKTALLDAQSVQLPYDVVARPPRARDLRFLRLVMARLITQLSAANLWVEAARETHRDDQEAAALAGEVRAWIAERPSLDGDAILDHAARGEDIDRRVAQAGALRLDAAQARERVLSGAMLVRLHELVLAWSVQDRILHALAAGSTLPPDLRAAARRARPVRSNDYLAVAIDIAPIALAFAGCATIWYLSAWSGAVGALLFAFIICGFTIGTPGAVRSAGGALLWTSLAFGLAFLYQFAILPQVTAFPVLIAVLAVALIPLGVFVAMSPAGVLIAALTFSSLGLQSVYAGDFLATLQSLGGSIAGCLFAIGALHLCRYDETRFRAVRLSRVVALDVAAAARARRTPSMDRYLSLSVDRLSLFFTAIETLDPHDPLRRQNMIPRYRMGASVIALRLGERSLGAAARAACDTLRRRIGKAYGGGRDTDRTGLLAEVERAYAVVAEEPAERRGDALLALTSLRITLARHFDPANPVADGAP